MRGLRSFLSSSNSRRGGSVLLFHRVSGNSCLPVEPDTAVSLNAFETIIEQVSRRCEALPLAELVRRAERGDSLAGCVSVTFDDGFADNLHQALPVMERYGVPGTFFVTSGFVNRDVIPMEYRLSQIVSQSLALKLDVEGESMSWETGTEEQKWACYRALQQHLKFSSESRRSNSLKCLAGQAPPAEAPEQFRMLSIDELRRLAGSPLVTIGAHTHAHLVLPSLTAESALADIRRGKAWLETELDQEVDQFAYPYGAHEVGVEKLVGRLGFQLAVTTRAEKFHGDSDSLVIPRIEVKEQDTSELVDRLVGSR